MAEIARARACQCDYRPTGAPPTRLGPGRLWARENHGTRTAMVKGVDTFAVFDIIEEWYTESSNYNIMRGQNRRCDDGSICEHYVQVTLHVVDTV